MPGYGHGSSGPQGLSSPLQILHPVPFMKKKRDLSEILSLIQRYIRQGDQDAYDELVTYYYREVQKNIYYTLKKFDTSTLDEYLRNNSADICHDFFMDKFEQVLRGYDSSKGSFWTWLCRCSSFYTIDYLRKKSTQSLGREESLQVEEEEWKSHYIIKEIAVEALENPHHEREQAELIEIIMRYVEVLPEHYRRTVKLRLQGLTDEEVARELKLPVGTVKSHYSRAKQILRDRLAGDGYL